MAKIAIAIGADEAGFELKEKLIGYLKEKGVEVNDFGVYDTKPVLYPDIAVAVARAIVDGQHERGILICGTGIGMAITANKVPGIRAAVCHDPYSAERARKSNNAQIMTLGARIIGTELAKLLVDTWLKSEFQGGGSTLKVDRIAKYEQMFLKTS
jgi:ribose 5-phosphate isomerase B